jgi:hypothetical protein
MSEYQRILEEIVIAIEIDEDFTVRHPDYPPLELEAETVARLKSLPLQLQAKYLTTQVNNYLYDLYFSHAIQTVAETEAQAQQPATIQNNLVNGIDRDFALRLRDNNLSNGYFDPDWQVVGGTEDGAIVVVKDGLHLHIDRRQHLAKNSRPPRIGDMVEICLPKNLLGEESYIAVSNFGLPDRQQSVELYFNFTPDAAIAIEQQVIRELNKLGIPFQFEILFNPAEFYRYDPGILCLSQSDYSAVQNLLANIYSAHQGEFSPPVPLFTHQLAPGVGIAETADAHISFGTHRCGIVASALVKAYFNGDSSPATRMTAIEQEFRVNKIDFDRHYLQSLSDRFYPNWQAVEIIH